MMGMGHGHGPGMAGEKAKDFKGTFKKLAVYLSKYKIGLLFVVIFAIGSAAFSIVGPRKLGDAVTLIFEGLVSKVTGAGTGIDFGAVGRLLLILLGLYVISAALSFIQGYIMSGITQKVSYNMRKSISEKIQRLPIKYFDTKTHGEVLSRVTNDVDTLSQSLNQSLTQIITSITTVIGVLIMMFSISWLMTLAALVILPISMLLISAIVGKSQKYFKTQQEYLGHINGQVEEVYGGHNIVRAFNNEQAVIKEFDETNETLYKSAWKSQFLSGMMQPMMQFIGNLGYVVVSILGGWLAIQGTIDVGSILSFSQYIRNFNQPIAQAAQVANLLQSTAAAAERVFEFLAEEEEDQVPARPAMLTETVMLDNGSEETRERLVTVEDLSGNVEFQHVRFGYSPDKIIIHDFNAVVRPGQKVAIVGPTGAGKTTLVNLLMRFYELDGGQIRIDGVATDQMKREDVHSLFCMVLQDTWLFEGTVRENLIYCTPNVSDEKMRAACKAVGLDHFIRSLPKGYDTVLNDSVSLSQGQKQQLTIARAMIADKPMLILDEATSSVDTRTELQIQRAMDELMRGRTSFVIAHRLSTIKNADLILVLRDGDVIESGTHEELLAKGGFYADLYNSQFEQAA